MIFVVTCLIFLVVMVAAAVIGTRMWVDPKQAVDRITGVQPEHADLPKHPSLVFHELVKKFGDYMPASPKDMSVMQKRLTRAGFRGPNALKVLYGAKLLFGVLVPLVMTALVFQSSADTANKVLAVLAAVAAGFFGPNEYVKIVTQRRQKGIQRGLPNALDLMVVCVESGLGLDQAMIQVSKELETANPEIAEEFHIANLELKAGKRRSEALRNLTERTGAEELKKLVAVLIQADRFGTGVAASLRSHADYMRVQARQAAEEKAAKLGVKLVFPIFFCILPSLFVVTVGPVAVRIVRDLLPMMNRI
ncbi:MAG: type II secretion system F family protein [Acidobacteria bacterium]|nr:type II secretion system F family protein [Acidobacteriota bacterium]